MNDDNGGCMESKRCSKCGEVKTVDNFYLSKETKDGYNFWCKKCHSIQGKKYSKANKEKIRKRKKKYREKYIEKFKLKSKKYYERTEQLRKKLTQDELAHFLIYDDLTGNFLRNTPSGNAMKGGIAGHKKKNGYINIRVNGVLYKAHHLVYFYKNGVWPDEGKDIHHKDGNPSNNKWENLELISKGEHTRTHSNSKRKDNKTGVVGVSFYKQNGKFAAQIADKGKKYYLGYYEFFDDAVMARWRKEKELSWYGALSTSTAYLYLKENGLIDE